MKSVKVFILLVLVLLLSVPVVQAQEGYTLDWWTVDGGGTTVLSVTGYALGGTIGQPDTGQLSGGGYTLDGGFWHGSLFGGDEGYVVYLPLVLRQ